ncbi:serine/threonine protein kinase [Spirochaeta dissipatitropha]
MQNNPEINAAEGSADFEQLRPELIIPAVEQAIGIELDGTINQYNSYINRVYEVRDAAGKPYMAKFYRPGRWTDEAILEEHEFIFDCAGSEIPTVAPLRDEDGSSLFSVESSSDERSVEFSFALFPKRSGRNFDAESDDDWLRLGALAGRLHSVSAMRNVENRISWTPRDILDSYVAELRESNCVHPDLANDFFELVESLLLKINDDFSQLPRFRIHGDFHRGNILDRSEEGLLLIDFDDMMLGPAVQDIWLLLPERAEECPREFNLIAEGYEQFRSFDYRWKSYIEGLRLMRMIYYLAWSARQRMDKGFISDFPSWGSKAFWMKEIEDIHEQARFI